VNNILPPVELTNAVEHILKTLQPGERVLVACSGGADSLALAWVTNYVAKKHEIFVAALVVDHQLFDESNQVAQDAKSKLHKIGISEVEIVKVSVEKSVDGLEAAARQARYGALNAHATKIAAKLILLGHTQEDQVETVLMRLTRGSGARSLQAMAEISENFARPFLHLRRDLVRDCLKKINIEAWEDPMNYSDKFLRSKIRNQLLPVLAKVLGDGIFDSIDKSARQLRDDNAALDLITQQTMALNAIDNLADIEILAAQPKAIRTRIIRKMMLNAGAPAAALANSHIEAANNLVVNWHGQGAVALPGKLWATRKSGNLIIENSN
jgi:tRNA(Ile)-lysidine synthase